MHRIMFTVVGVLALVSSMASAQDSLSPALEAAIHYEFDYTVVPNVVYSTATNYECKLDAYVRHGESSPVALVIHGGGWVAGTKEQRTLECVPFMAMGFSVVNVEYRLARVAFAPAAVEDCRLALEWVFRNATKYHFDTSRVIVTGGSAGGHLALMTGLLQASDGFDASKEWEERLPGVHVAAIINWFGITDVNELLAGPNRQDYAVSWLGTLTDRESVAKRVSPLTYVRKTSPPVFTIHGDRDQLVPYQQAVRLKNALDAAGVDNVLITIPGGRHGGFSHADYVHCFTAIHAFLQKHGILSQGN
jgi:acetyl esterase/lipase